MRNGLGLLWLAMGVASAQTLYWLGALTSTGGNSYAHDVSDNGLVIGGESNGCAVLWRLQLSPPLAQIVPDCHSSYANAVNSGGTRAAGTRNTTNNGGAPPFTWTSPGTITTLPAVDYQPFNWTWDMDPTGTYVVGKYADGPSSFYPALWDLSTNPITRHTYSTGCMSVGEGYGISDDASRIVVFGHGGSGGGYRSRVFTLSSDKTSVTDCVVLPTPTGGSVAQEISRDGTIAVGFYGPCCPWTMYPAMWRESDSWDITPLPTAGSTGRAFDIKGDTIVGWLTISGSQRAVMWYPATGTNITYVDLNTLFSGCLGSSVLREATAISRNSRWIVGWGHNATTNRDEGFLIDMQGGSGGCAPLAIEVVAEAGPPKPQPKLALRVECPNSDGCKAYLSLSESDVVFLQLTDAMGRQIPMPTQLSLEAGEHTLALPQGLSEGVYLLQVIAQGEIQNLRFLVKY